GGASLKYGLIPEGIKERLAVRLGRVPVPVLDSLFCLLKARALMAGVSLGVFEAIGVECRPASGLAIELSLDEQCLDLLLRVLVFSGYVKKKRQGYALTRLGRRKMLPGGDMEMVGFMRWNYTQWAFVERLEELIRTGDGLDFHSAMRQQGAWENYQRAMLEVARSDAETLAKLVPIPRGAKRILDLGGSHGLLSGALCRKYPPMKATVIDLPDAIRPARELARAEGIDDIVEHRSGNLLNDNLGSGYEAALLANVLHHFDTKQIPGISNRVREVLKPGGIVAIWEIEAPCADDKIAATDAAALYFRLVSSARAYNGKDYLQWLEKAGFKDLTIKRPGMCPGLVLWF